MQLASAKYAEEVEQLIDEDQNALDNLGLTKDSAVRKLAHDECQTQAKVYGDIHRYRQAEVKAEKNLIKDIRFLHNGGLAFNPYL